VSHLIFHFPPFFSRSDVCTEQEETPDDSIEVQVKAEKCPRTKSDGRFETPTKACSGVTLSTLNDGDFGHASSSSLATTILDFMDWERGTSKKDSSQDQCSNCDVKQATPGKATAHSEDKGWQFWKEIDGVVISRKKSGRLFQCRGYGVCMVL
jgi:hypothetical protein